MNVTTIGIDLATNLFQAHGVGRRARQNCFAEIDQARSRATAVFGSFLGALTSSFQQPWIFRKDLRCGLFVE
jgi:hypothetical protein